MTLNSKAAERQQDTALSSAGLHLIVIAFMGKKAQALVLVEIQVPARGRWQCELLLWKEPSLLWWEKRIHPEITGHGNITLTNPLDTAN